MNNKYNKFNNKIQKWNRNCTDYHRYSYQNCKVFIDHRISNFEGEYCWPPEFWLYFYFLKRRRLVRLLEFPFTIFHCTFLLLCYAVNQSTLAAAEISSDRRLCVGNLVFTHFPPYIGQALRVEHRLWVGHCPRWFS